VELKWTSVALDDIDAAGSYIADDNPRAALDMANRVIEATAYLADHPTLGRQGRLRGTRELVVSGTPFLIIYRIRYNEVQLLRVLHHARRWP
jgi:toxin ParE1/3/4